MCSEILTAKYQFFREVMDFPWLMLFLINGAFMDLSKSSPNGKIDPGPKSSPKIDQNQKENTKEEEPRKVQPNIILVLVSLSENKIF